MEISSPSWLRSRKSGARTPSGISAPSNVLGEPSSLSRPLAASTIAPSAKTPTRRSATTIRGFTARRLEVAGSELELVALPVHLAPPADRALVAHLHEAGALVESACVAQVVEGEQRQALVARRASGLQHVLDQPASRTRAARLRREDEVSEPAEAAALVVERDRP